jgi:hypothetical protein
MGGVMMASVELIKEHVMDVVVVDFENLEQLADEVVETLAAEGYEVSAALICDALAELVEHGIVDCYRFSRSKHKFKHTEFDPSKSNLWFRISAKGKRLLAAQGE